MWCRVARSAMTLPFVFGSPAAPKAVTLSQGTGDERMWWWWWLVAGALRRHRRRRQDRPLSFDVGSIDLLPTLCASLIRLLCSRPDLPKESKFGRHQQPQEAAKTRVSFPLAYRYVVPLKKRAARDGPDSRPPVPPYSIRLA
ncbi:hypothetical protein IWX91DRAFT_341564 [Phyllosticta citricarpa]